jgi:hypothetical protein
VAVESAGIILVKSNAPGEDSPKPALELWLQRGCLAAGSRDFFAAVGALLMSLGKVIVTIHAQFLRRPDLSS